MKTIEAIKPGPKPNKQDGTLDRRQRVTTETSCSQTWRFEIGFVIYLHPD